MVVSAGLRVVWLGLVVVMVGLEVPVQRLASEEGISGLVVRNFGRVDSREMAAEGGWIKRMRWLRRSGWGGGGGARVRRSRVARVEAIGKARSTSETCVRQLGGVRACWC